MDIEYRTLNGLIRTLNIPDASSIRVSNEDFAELLDACDEELIAYLEGIDLEVLTLLLISSPGLMDKLSLAIKQAKEDLD